jgi:transcriptional regulator with XRE-family HTH domain
VKPHFGQWFRRLRAKLGLTLEAMAPLVDLESFTGVANIEKRPERRMRDTTLEALLELTGYESEEDLDAAWRANEFPDVAMIRLRLNQAKELTRRSGGKMAETQNERVRDVVRWLAEQPVDRTRSALTGITTAEALAAVDRLLEHVRKGKA